MCKMLCGVEISVMDVTEVVKFACQRMSFKLFSDKQVLYLLLIDCQTKSIGIKVL